MLFNSWTFAAFLAVAFAVHYLVGGGHRRGFYQVGLLTLASYIFYAWHTPWLSILLALSSGINALATHRLLDTARPRRVRRAWLWFAVGTNLGILAFFKYASLLVETFVPGSWWAGWGFSPAEIPLPIGISFYTFQGISLVVDVYRGGAAGVPGLILPRTGSSKAWFFLQIGFFKAFFPQLVAGPIVKAHEFFDQIGAKAFRNIDWDYAIRRLIIGYFFKMVVADNLQEATAQLSYPAFVGMPGINLLFLLYGFSFQIFADFCGYTFIAMGLAAMFGYRLPVNFNYPYLARSITEFWRRWHISLSTWLKEYLYIPLGGNRRGLARTYFNLIVVMLLGGLWHGAAWSYMVWGGAHGLFLALERFASGVCGTTLERLRRLPGGWMLDAAQIVLTFHLVSALWLLFQLPRFDQAVLYARELLAWKPGFSPQGIYAVCAYSSPIIVYHLWGLVRGRFVSVARGGLLRDAAYAAMLFLIVTNSGNPGAFIYFQF